MRSFLFKSKDRMDMLALGICLLALVVWAILLSYKFFHFGYYDWDLAFFAQGMWNLCHGSSYVSLFDTNLFSNHANLIAYLIVPIYKIFPHPLTLVFLKVLSYVTAAFTLYVLTKEKLGGATAVFFLCLYLIFIPNMLGLFYEFDFESLAPAFLMLIFYFYEKERWLGFLICAGVLMLIKENMPLIILAFSIHGLIVKKNKVRWAIIPGTLALVFFYLLVFIFIPYASGKPLGDGHSYYIGHNYGNLGGSVGGVLLSFIFHPLNIFHQVMTPVNIHLLLAMFNPFMYLPLASPGVIFLASPVILQHLLSSSDTEHSICFAYTLTITPFLFMATVETLKFLHERIKKVYPFMLLLLFILNVLSFIISFADVKERFMVKGALNQDQVMLQHQRELFDLVPKHASVVASFSFLAPLSQRNGLYAFYKIYDSKYQNDKWSYKLPANVRYALIDIHDPWLMQEDDYNLAKARAQKFLTSGDWSIQKRYGNFILYKRQ